VNHRRFKVKQIIAILLTFVVPLVMCRCTSPGIAEGLEPVSMNPSERIFGISFDDATPVTVRLDRTGLKEANRAYRIRIEYVERPNTAGDIAPVRSQFINVYFLAYGFVDEDSFVAVSMQLVVDIWDHEPSSETKTCYQWLLIDSNIDDIVDTIYAESFAQDRWNIVQKIRQIRVPSKEHSEYSRLYRRFVGYLLTRMGFHSTNDLYKNLSWDSILGRPKKMVRSLDRAVDHGE
jgi:hypothetical protein